MKYYSIFLSIALLYSFPTFASDGKSVAAAAAASSAAAVVTATSAQMKAQVQQAQKKEAESLQAFEAEQRATFAQQHPELAALGKQYLQQRFETFLILSEEDTKAGTALVAQLNPNVHVDQNHVPGYKPNCHTNSNNYKALAKNYAALEVLSHTQFAIAPHNQRLLWLKIHKNAKGWQKTCTDLIQDINNNNIQLARQKEAFDRQSRRGSHHILLKKPNGFVASTAHTAPLPRVTQGNWINFDE